MTTAASSRAVFVGLLSWLVLATVAAATGTLARLHPPGPQLVILALSIAAIVAATSVTPVRAWVDGLSLRTLVGIHVVRFVGAAFLVLSANGLLSPVFAARAGWGDIATAAGAVLLLIAGPPAGAIRRAFYHAWNAFGALDLLVAVGTATMVVFRGDVPGMQPLLRLPYALVPTFFVPVLFASHVVLFRRLSADRPAQ